MEQTISRIESSSSTTSICSPTMGIQVLGKKLIITSFQSNGNGECLNFGNRGASRQNSIDELVNFGLQKLTISCVFAVRGLPIYYLVNFLAFVANMGI